MRKININEKSKIDRQVLSLACSNQKRFTAPYIAKHEAVDIKIVRKRLFQLRNDNQLIVNFEIICPDCYEDLITYHNEKEIPIGKELYCSECDKPIIVEPENIWINFTPNRKYYSKDMCEKICEDKKKR